MLLKVYCDRSCPFVQRQGANEMTVMWSVQEDLPLTHPTQVEALLTAIGADKGATKSLALGEYVLRSGAGAASRGGRVGGERREGESDAGSSVTSASAATSAPLDVALTPTELALHPGAVVTMVYRGGGVATRRASEAVVASVAVSRRPSGLLNTSGVMSASYAGNDTATDDEATDDEEDLSEVYVSHEIGWFPFMLRPSEGEPLVVFNDPFLPVKEEDPRPMTQTLCEECAALVTHGDALRVAVDRHLKPTLMHQDFMEVCVEKLGGGQLARWQTRYVHFSDKSIDWFSERPKPGVKSRIHGHRYLVRDGVCQVTEIVKDPDVATYPKCRDPSFHYFGVAFANPSKTYLFRVTNEQQKSIILSFLRVVVARTKNRGATRNPVVWKKWADLFLVNAANVGELHGENSDVVEQLQVAIAAQQQELDAILAEKPELVANLQARTGYVQALRNELAGHEKTVVDARHRIHLATERLEEERTLLREKEIEMGDEVRKATMLEHHTMQQRAEAEARIRELQDKIAVLREREHALFKRWRAYEERHLVAPKQTAQTPTGLYSFSQSGIGLRQPAPRLSLAEATKSARASLARTSATTLSRLQLSQTPLPRHSPHPAYEP